MERKAGDPLGLPNGSVRAILTVMLVGITAAVLFIPVAKGTDDVKAMFVLLTGMARRDTSPAATARPSASARPTGATTDAPSRAPARSVVERGQLEGHQATDPVSSLATVRLRRPSTRGLAISPHGGHEMQPERREPRGEHRHLDDPWMATANRRDPLDHLPIGHQVRSPASNVCRAPPTARRPRRGSERRRRSRSAARSVRPSAASPCRGRLSTEGDDRLEGRAPASEGPCRAHGRHRGRAAREPARRFSRRLRRWGARSDASSPRPPR